MHTVESILSQLRELGTPAAREGMQRFGIDVSHALGVSIPALRALGKKIKKDHALALALWESGCHEARILASIIDDPALVTTRQIDAWVKEFNSWDLCDQVCGNLFDRTAFAVEKAIAFSKRKEEFVKRAGFVLMAEYAVHNKKAEDEVFLSFLPLIEKEAHDDRNFVKKAVNWALRQIGKRNARLRKAAISTAERILQQDSKAAQWVARDALKELKKIS
ncbi:MAG: DNA alkylation repair protein [Sphingobacteriales bacterium 50-39]|nr:DNA alkylation repair protein [Sphingobacteriales bacterium]OJW60538.1 MAG: DNA alkylation repair protein [Sphingobacteriales bacterium 50-39]